MSYTAQKIESNYWIVIDDNGINHKVFCNESNNTEENAISLIRDFVDIEVV